MPDNELNTEILTVLLVALLAIPLLIKIIVDFTDYSREKWYIRMEMNRADNDNEYRYWRRELSYLRLTLIPFVNDRNVQKVYSFYHRGKHTARKKSDVKNFAMLFAPAVIGIVVCLISVSGLTWAWFATSTSTGTTKIQAASYTVLVNALQNETPLTPTEENSIISVSLTSGNTYSITITPTGNAKTGYCTVNFEGTYYYTAQLTDHNAPLTFTVHASEKAALTITPQWGTCAVASKDNTIIANAELGKNSTNNSDSVTLCTELTTPQTTIQSLPTDTTTTTEEPSTSTEPTETVPETTAPSTEQTQSEPEETAPDTVPTETSSTRNNRMNAESAAQSDGVSLCTP